MRFYTYAPIKYPFILRNINQKPKDCKHEIVDSGIMVLLKFPEYSDEKIKKWKNLKVNGWKVVPDCPDLNKEYQKHIINFDNIEYSKQLLYELYNPEDPSNLPVIQGHYMDVESFRKYIYWFKKEFGIPKQIGIGTICKLSIREIAIKVLKIARSEFSKSWIHAFGMRLDFVKMVPFIDSFDSTGWTRPRGQGHSCKNKRERETYFNEFLKTFKRYSLQKSLHFFK